MNTKFKQYEKTKDAIDSLKSDTKRALEKLKGNAPKDVYEKVENLHVFLSAYDIEALRPKPEILEGELFDHEPLKEQITQATGYIWKIRELTEPKDLDERGYTKEDYEFRYNISPTSMRVFEFYRDSNSRNEVWMLVLVLIPGKAMIEYSTGRVDGHTEWYNSPKALVENLYKYF